MFKKLFDKVTQPIHTSNVPTSNYLPTATVTIPASATINPNYSYANITTAAAIAGAGVAPPVSIGIANPPMISAIGSGVNMGAFGNITSAFQAPQPTNIIAFHAPMTNKEIVKLNLDGSVEWANGIDIDAAAEAFGRSLHLAAEQKSGITQRVKLKMRDSVFEDLINIAKEKGSLSAEDLTYLLEASKIVEKLKGG